MAIVMRPTAPPSHLAPALLAAATVALLFSGIQLYVIRQLPRRMTLFAAFTSPIKLTGNVLQTQAFTLPDILPIYGSSELDRDADNRPDAFFRAKPSGFTVFPIGRGGTQCLMILQKLAAVGPAVRGKKTAIILSPTWFAKESATENAVDSNLTSAQVSAWVFGDELSPETRQKIALRLRDYPAALKDQRLLKGALECLSDPTTAHRLLFAALTPLGKAQNVLLARLESCAILREMLVYPRRLPGPRTKDGHPARPDERSDAVVFDWPRLAADAEARDRQRGGGTVYSAATAPPSKKPQHERRIRPQVPGSRDADFVAGMQGSREWDDLALLLTGLKELGADAMFVSQPFNGTYRDLGGTSPAGRRIYYARLAAAIAPSGYPVRDYSDHEEDRFFFNDSGHPSAKAWIYFDRALDEFYRGLHD